MTLSDIVSQYGGQAELARQLGVDKGYLNRAVKSGKVGAGLAVRIYRLTKVKLGPIADATPQQIAAVERLSVRGAA